MTCALCKSDSPLRKSHIIPEFLYTSLYDNVHRFYVVPFNSSRPHEFKQKGLYENLLCESCEQKFSAWEKYAKEAFFDGVGVNIEHVGKVCKLSNLDYRKFRLFLLSLLWRMGVSKLAFFAQVQLGEKHQEILRRALLDDDPLEPLQYPCVLSAVSLNGEILGDWISEPLHAKNEGKHCYCVVIIGLFFCFYVTSHAMAPVYGEICIGKSNQMKVHFGEVKDIPLLADCFSSLERAIKIRIQESSKA